VTSIPLLTSCIKSISLYEYTPIGVSNKHMFSISLLSDIFPTYIFVGVGCMANKEMLVSERHMRPH
jgi:Na+-transporting methylmalonyl-CoA/oxaloacetate decarboxylase beta subunit